jgi:hypothetical protein
MIYLDGFLYHVQGSDYHDAPKTFSQQGVGLTGYLLVAETNLYRQEFTFTLNVDQRESEQLKASFQKCHAGVYLNFIDERNVFYDVTAGTDTASHKFSTGAWLASLGEPKPVTEMLFDEITSTYLSPYRRFTVAVHLIINSLVLT